MTIYEAEAFINNKDKMSNLKMKLDLKSYGLERLMPLNNEEQRMYEFIQDIISPLIPIYILYERLISCTRILTSICR